MSDSLPRVWRCELAEEVQNKGFTGVLCRPRHTIEDPAEVFANGSDLYIVGPQEPKEGSLPNPKQRLRSLESFLMRH